MWRHFSSNSCFCAQHSQFYLNCHYFFIKSPIWRRKTKMLLTHNSKLVYSRTDSVWFFFFNINCWRCATVLVCNWYLLGGIIGILMATWLAPYCSNCLRLVAAFVGITIPQIKTIWMDVNQSQSLNVMLAANCGGVW